MCLEFSHAQTYTRTRLSDANTRAPVRDDLDEKPLERKANISEADAAVPHDNIPFTHKTRCCVSSDKFI